MAYSPISHRHPPLLAIGSGKGGVGKSTLAINLAFALSHRGLCVGLVDLDITAPDIPRFLNLRRSTPATHIELWRSAPAERLKPVAVKGISVLSVGFLLAENQALMLSGKLPALLVERFLDGTAWTGIDILVVDLPPGTDDVTAAVLADPDTVGLLVVVTPHDLAHLDARRLVRTAMDSGTRVLGAVENFAASTCPHCGGEVPFMPPVALERSLWADGIPKLASIPMDGRYAQAADHGSPSVLAEPTGPLVAPFSALAEKVSTALGNMSP